MSSSDREPLINVNPQLQSYYASLESRIGYRLVLGGTRHFGYYPSDTYWPFPISRALRAMEDHLFTALALPSGSTVLDAGCGVGHVAMQLARKGLQIQAIDVVEHHIEKAQRNVRAQHLSDHITVQKGDYHHLDQFDDRSFDGAYTMETFVHATDPLRALREFYRVLKPGGRLAMFEYDHDDPDAGPADLKDSMEKINRYAAMPANAQFAAGVLEAMLEEVGFRDVELEDLSVRIRPMLRLFFLLAYLPWLLVRLFGLEAWFVNTVAGVQSYRGKDSWRYVAITARRPVELEAASRGARDRRK